MIRAREYCEGEEEKSSEYYVTKLQLRIAGEDKTKFAVFRISFLIKLYFALDTLTLLLNCKNTQHKTPRPEQVDVHMHIQLILRLDICLLTIN